MRHVSNWTCRSCRAVLGQVRDGCAPPARARRVGGRTGRGAPTVSQLWASKNVGPIHVHAHLGGAVPLCCSARLKGLLRNSPGGQTSRCRIAGVGSDRYANRFPGVSRRSQQEHLWRYDSPLQDGHDPTTRKERLIHCAGRVSRCRIATLRQLFA